MTIKEALKIVNEFNQWRRGAIMPQPNPKNIGIAIDVLIENTEKILKLKK